MSEHFLKYAFYNWLKKFSNYPILLNNYKHFYSILKLKSTNIVGKNVNFKVGNIITIINP